MSWWIHWAGIFRFSYSGQWHGHFTKIRHKIKHADSPESISVWMDPKWAAFFQADLNWQEPCTWQAMCYWRALPKCHVISPSRRYYLKQHGKLASAECESQLQKFRGSRAPLWQPWTVKQEACFIQISDRGGIGLPSLSICSCEIARDWFTIKGGGFQCSGNQFLPFFF